MSLARSLLQAWVRPLLILSQESGSLPAAAQGLVSTRLLELLDHASSLQDGLDVLSSKVGPGGEGGLGVEVGLGVGLWQGRGVGGPRTYSQLHTSARLPHHTRHALPTKQTHN